MQSPNGMKWEIRTDRTPVTNGESKSFDSAHSVVAVFVWAASLLSKYYFHSNKANNVEHSSKSEKLTVRCWVVENTVRRVMPFISGIKFKKHWKLTFSVPFVRPIPPVQRQRSTTARHCFPNLYLHWADIISIASISLARRLPGFCLIWDILNFFPCRSRLKKKKSKQPFPIYLISFGSRAWHRHIHLSAGQKSK